jgi:hypothetical protein
MIVRMIVISFVNSQPHSIGLYHPLDGVTNPRYTLLCFLTTNFFYKEKKALAFNWDRCCHLALCLRLIHLHSNISGCRLHCKSIGHSGALLPTLHLLHNLRMGPISQSTTLQLGICDIRSVTNYSVYFEPN